MALAQQIAQSREDSAGFGAADIVGHRICGDVQQRIAREVAAAFGQLLDRFGDQLHGLLEVGQTFGLAHQFSRAPGSPADGARCRPACASAVANALSRSPATREAVGAISRSSDAIIGPSFSLCARPHNATKVASSWLTIAQVGRWMRIARRAPNRNASIAIAKSGSTSIRPACLKP